MGSHIPDFDGDTRHPDFSLHVDRILVHPGRLRLRIDQIVEAGADADGGAREIADRGEQPVRERIGQNVGGGFTRDVGDIGVAGCGKRSAQSRSAEPRRGRNRRV